MNSAVFATKCSIRRALISALVPGSFALRKEQDLASPKVAGPMPPLTLYQAIFLGIIQGLTEFLPISSSGHLRVLPWIFDWPIFRDPALDKTFAVALHLGTLVALFAYFWREAITLVGAWARSVWECRVAGDFNRKLAWMILASTIPGALFGYLGEEAIEQKLGAPLLIASMLIAFALLLALSERLGRKERPLEQLAWPDAIIIGCAQALALVPGVSRSGVTITVGLLLALRRETAARFAFLMSMPVVAGAALLKGLRLATEGLPVGMAAPFVAGMTAAAASGYLAVSFLLRFLQTRTLYPFAWYRLAVGAGLLVLWAVR